MDNSIFVEVKGKKRTAILRDSNRAARSAQPIDVIPESMPITIEGTEPAKGDFNLQDYLDIVKASHTHVEEFEFVL